VINIDNFATMNKNNSSGSPLINNQNPCQFLLLISYTFAFLLITLNLYIAYQIVVYFMGDGFQFMGGMVLGTSYIATIPANIIFFTQSKKIKRTDKLSFTFYMIIGIITFLTGLILHNATPIWPAINILGLLLIIATIICNRHKKKANGLS